MPVFIRFVSPFAEPLDQGAQIRVDFQKVGLGCLAGGLPQPSQPFCQFNVGLLESNNAVGARIHREGLPTLVGFKTDPAAREVSLSGFGFSGPVGVSVFKPKQTKL